MRNIEITPQKNSANDGNDFERVDTFSYENEPLDAFLLESSGSTDNTEKKKEFYRLRNVPRDRSVRISELLAEVDRTDVGRKLI